MILSSCNLPGSPASPTQTTGQNMAMTLQVNPTKTRIVIIPTQIMPTVTASPMPTPFPPNTPVWSAYQYTCEFTDGGGNMTMSLAWDDRSVSEEGYRIYRDNQVIATLEPNSMFYIDVAFVATGKTLSYSVEAFNTNWQAGSSVIIYGCQ